MCVFLSRLHDAPIGYMAQLRYIIYSMKCHSWEPLNTQQGLLEQGLPSGSEGGGYLLSHVGFFGDKLYLKERNLVPP